MAVSVFRSSHLASSLLSLPYPCRYAQPAPFVHDCSTPRSLLAIHKSMAQLPSVETAPCTHTWGSTVGDVYCLKLLLGLLHGTIVQMRKAVAARKEKHNLLLQPRMGEWQLESHFVGESHLFEACFGRREIYIQPKCEIRY